MQTVPSTWSFHVCLRNCLPLDHGVPALSPPHHLLQTLLWPLRLLSSHASILSQSPSPGPDCASLPFQVKGGWGVSARREGTLGAGKPSLGEPAASTSKKVEKRKSYSVTKDSKLFSGRSSSSLPFHLPSFS